MAMPKVYSDDLRRKLLEAHRRGEGRLAQQAARAGAGALALVDRRAGRPDTGGVARPPGAGVGFERQCGAPVDGVAGDEPATEKKSLHAAEQDTEAGRRQRAQWWEQMGRIDAQRLIFLDESGVTTELTRRYGRAVGGARVQEGTPAGHWKTLTVLGAVSQLGWVAMMTIEAATDGEVFQAYLEFVVSPHRYR